MLPLLLLVVLLVAPEQRVAALPAELQVPGASAVHQMGASLPLVLVLLGTAMQQASMA